MVHCNNRERVEAKFRAPVIILPPDLADDEAKRIAGFFRDRYLGPAQEPLTFSDGIIAGALMTLLGLGAGLFIAILAGLDARP